MKKLIFFLLIFNYCKAQTLTVTPQIIYSAGSDTTITVSFANQRNVDVGLYCKSSDSVYISGSIICARCTTVFQIPLSAGDVITARAEMQGVSYQLFKQDGITPISQTATIDSSLIQIKSVAQSTVGTSLNNLTATQVRSLLAILLYNVGALTPDNKIKPFSKWVK